MTQVELGTTCIISASDDATLRVWKRSDGSQLQMLSSHSESISALKLFTSLAGRCHHNRVVSGSLDKKVLVWDFSKTGRLKLSMTLDDHKSAIKTVDCDEKYIVSAAEDCSMKL